MRADGGVGRVHQSLHRLKQSAMSSDSSPERSRRLVLSGLRAALVSAVAALAVAAALSAAGIREHAPASAIADSGPSGGGPSTAAAGPSVPQTDAESPVGVGRAVSVACSGCAGDTA